MNKIAELAKLAAEQSQQPDYGGAASNLFAAGGMGSLTGASMTSVQKNRPYRQLSHLELGQRLWTGPEREAIADQLRLSQAARQQIFAWAERSPRRFQAALAGLASLPGVAPSVLAKLRSRTFNTPFTSSTSKLGDILVRMYPDELQGLKGRLFEAATGGNVASAGFDTGPKFPGQERLGKTIRHLAGRGSRGEGNVFREWPSAFHGPGAEFTSAVRLRPRGAVSAETLNEAIPRIKEIYGPNTRYNTLLLHRMAPGMVTQEAEGPISRFVQRMGEFMGRNNRWGRLGNLTRPLGLSGMVRNARKRLLPFQHCGHGEVCTTAAAKALRSLHPSVMTEEAAAAASPRTLLNLAKGSQPSMEVASLNLARGMRRPGRLMTQHALTYGPAALRAIPGMLAAPAALYFANQGLQNLQGGK